MSGTARQRFEGCFGRVPAVVAVLHLDALPGAPRYAGPMDAVIAAALERLEIVERARCFDGVVVENFGDVPFLPGSLPAETVAALAVVTAAVVRSASLPVGVNALRSDGEAAVAIAHAAGARFVRVNVHMGAVVADQGLVEGRSWATMRLRRALGAGAVMVLADVAVKHAAPLGARSLADEAQDLEHRGLADGLVVSGSASGAPTAPEDAAAIRAASSLPLLAGSGVTAETVGDWLRRCDGVIVGTALERDGVPGAALDPARVGRFADAAGAARARRPLPG